MDESISQQAAIDIERNATVDTNPDHFEAHQKFTQFMDDAEISSFGRWQWSNGFNTTLIAVGIDLKKLPSAQPEERTETHADDLISRMAAVDAFRQELVFDYEEQCTTFAGIKKILETLPPAQPEIVRCKDCIHWKDFACMKTCDVFDWQSTENDFCSFAERREE